MKLSGQQTLPVAQALAWAALNDVALLQAAVPGCEALTPAAEPDTYDVLIAVAVGPVKAKFKGRLQLSDLQPPSSYRLAFDGSGGAAGHGKGRADVRLEALGAAETLLSYDVEASVGGRLAQVGSRLVDLAAQKLAEDFFARFRAALLERHPAPRAEVTPPPAPATRPSLWARLLGWLFRRGA